MISLTEILMKTEWFSEAEQADADRAHDECNKKVETLTVEYKIASGQLVRERDRAESRMVAKLAARTGVPADMLKFVRDSQGVPIGMTRPD